MFLDILGTKQRQLFRFCNHPVFMRVRSVANWRIFLLRSSNGMSFWHVRGKNCLHRRGRLQINAVFEKWRIVFRNPFGSFRQWHGKPVYPNGLAQSFPLVDKKMPGQWALDETEISGFSGRKTCDQNSHHPCRHGCRHHRTQQWVWWRDLTPAAR